MTQLVIPYAPKKGHMHRQRAAERQNCSSGKHSAEIPKRLTLLVGRYPVQCRACLLYVLALRRCRRRRRAVEPPLR
eukprot:6212800-Pleurochrysis_carterae.AAC.3